MPKSSWTSAPLAWPEVRSELPGLSAARAWPEEGLAGACEEPPAWGVGGAWAWGDAGGKASRHGGGIAGGVAVGGAVVSSSGGRRPTALRAGAQACNFFVAIPLS